MKVFISLPFTGVEDTIEERYTDGINWLFANYKDCSIQTVAQANIQDLIDSKQSCSADEFPYYMGKDIQTILESDAILMCDGWENSKGCQLEHKAAELFNINIIYKK